MRASTPEARGQALVDAFPDSGNWYLLIYNPPSMQWAGSAVRHEFTLDDLASVLRKSGEMRDALTVAVELLDRLSDDDACEYDHYDNCRVHSLNRRPCPHPLARQLMAAWRDVEREEQQALEGAESRPWPRTQRMPLMIAGARVRPWHMQAVAEYDEACGGTTVPNSNIPGMFAAAQVNQTIAWWNERADRPEEPA